MKTFYGLGKAHPSGIVRFFEEKAYKLDEDGYYKDEIGDYWSLNGMMRHVRDRFIRYKPTIEENE